MATLRITPGNRRWTVVAEKELHLLFDGLAGLDEAFAEFLVYWSRSSTPLIGNAFQVFVEGKDYTSMTSEVGAIITVQVGTYLLLRVDDAHPFFGASEPGWVLIKPAPLALDAPKILGRVSDKEAAVSPQPSAERSTIVAPQDRQQTISDSANQFAGSALLGRLA